MLANLDRSFERRADYRSLLWVSRLRLRIPDLPSGDRVHLSARLGTLGRFDDAADVLDELAAAQPTPDVADPAALGSGVAAGPARLDGHPKDLVDSRRRVSTGRLVGRPETRRS